MKSQVYGFNLIPNINLVQLLHVGSCRNILDQIKALEGNYCSIFKLAGVKLSNSFDNDFHTILD